MSAINIATSSGESVSISEERLADLEANLRGAVLKPSDEAYDGCRSLRNAMIDHAAMKSVGIELA